MKKMSLKMMDWDTEYARSLENNTGFEIRSDIDYSDYLDSDDVEHIKKIYTIDSIYSYKFGMSNQIDVNDDTIKKLYTCKCHLTYGIENLNTVCEHCDTYVRRSIPYRKGWINLHNHKILHPYLCYLLYTSVRYEKNSELDTDDDNEEVEEVDTEDKNTKRKKKLDKVRLFDLLTQNKLKYTWEDILFKGKLMDFLNEYFNSGHSSKMIELLRDRLFTSKILVMTNEYRVMKINKVLGVPEIIQDSYNVKYMNISDNVRMLLSESHYMSNALKIQYLRAIMKNVATLMIDVIQSIGGSKTAHIRSTIYSRRMTFSNRYVIEPIFDKNLSDINTVQIPLDGFRLSFSNDLKKLFAEDGISIKNVNRFINPDITLTQEERDYIRSLLPRLDSPVQLIVREPSINRTSTLGVKITLIDDDNYRLGTEMVMRVPWPLLPAVAGDFDGDVMGGTTWEESIDRMRVFLALAPKASVINTVDISYNRNIGVNNNAAVLLYKGFHKDAKIVKLAEKP